MRITAPETPYNDDIIKEIFQLLVGSFQGLDDDTSPYFAKRVTMLETFVKIRFGNTMCYPLVVKRLFL